MLLKCGKDLYFSCCSGQGNITHCSFLTCRKILGHLFSHRLQVTSGTEIFSKNNFGMGLQGRPTEACFLSISSVYSDSCFHTKVVSRCVLNTFPLITFSRWIQHNLLLTQQESPSLHTQTPQNDWNCSENMGTDSLTGSFASFLSCSAQTSY